MSIFSYHLIELPFFEAVKRILSSPISKDIKGLIHSEYMTAMTLGAPIFSTSRVLIGQVAVFMQWKNENALENYLEQDSFGRILAKGWHLRLSFIREWGKFSGFKLPNDKDQLESPNSPVVAVTIARMKPLAVPRFIHWGRPVEKLVRDHPGTTLSLASVKFPNTVSTFSIWKSEKEMTDMVHGHSKVEKPKRHSNVMQERERKDFHFEFTTLRFKPLAEYGEWKGQSNFILNN
ncbi:hypothetical protein SAMN04487906_2388 [Zhouia amylolytica]|uniref:Spheroidene monooxygenase n=1 Tax=Zhouia amylolytica TaxID=376730 RepID=A0A1I6U5G3_9FLAO|nr:hypothetical protein [Zhouia amylolytica]SFS96696.1 hypothetical protein SAMN04487906_2388 [Zhouia amylolytica]